MGGGEEFGPQRFGKRSWEKRGDLATKKGKARIDSGYNGILE